MRIIFFLLLPFILYANYGFKISADKIAFDKNNLNFDKGFFLEHNFGKIYANKAEFTNFQKKLFYDFQLKDGVKLITNTNALLTSDNATYNSLTSKIKFFSKDTVNYLDKIKKKDLKIQSREVECVLDNKCFKKNINVKDIYSISFIQEVILTLDNKYKIYADKALFKQNKTSNINLFPKENETCLFTFENSYVIASSANLDLDNLNLYLEKPNGIIKNILKNQNNLYFSSNKLSWHNFENVLLLQENVQIVDLQFGIINSEEVELLKKIKENSVRKIISRKNTTINFHSKSLCKLTTKGIIELDHEKNQISAFSSKNQADDLLYQDENIFISAKKAKLNYTKNSVNSVTLENDVKFTYQKDKNQIGYGIADKIDYIPHTKTIKLISNDDKKVLFWQKDNSLRLSAKEIVINQKPKPDIKGIGDVRFTFNLEEENLIHEIFSKYMTYE